MGVLPGPRPQQPGEHQCYLRTTTLVQETPHHSHRQLLREGKQATKPQTAAAVNHHKEKWPQKRHPDPREPTHSRAHTPNLVDLEQQAGKGPAKLRRLAQQILTAANQEPWQSMQRHPDYPSQQ